MGMHLYKHDDCSFEFEQSETEGSFVYSTQESTSLKESH